MPHPIYLSSFDYPYIWWTALIKNLFIMKFYPAFIISAIFGPHINVKCAVLNPLALNILYT
jgi:hypothetical protein